MKRSGLFAAAVSVLLFGAPASADVVDDGTWEILGTGGIKLFDSTDLVGWRDNNFSPVPYPTSGDPYYLPSPGKYNFDVSEHFDLERLIVHYDSQLGQLTVWLVTSMGPDGFNPAGLGGYQDKGSYYLGDVLIDVDGLPGAQPYDFALISGDNSVPVYVGKTSTLLSNPWPEGRTEGALVQLAGDTLFHDINGYYSYYSDTVIEGYVNPWAVESGFTVLDSGPSFEYEKVAATTLAEGSGIDEADAATANIATGGTDLTGKIDHDGRHDTWVYRWDVTSDALKGYDLDNFTLHVTIQCGNDLIEGGGTSFSTPPPAIPVPGAIGLGAFGLGLVGMVLERRRRR